MGLYRQAPLKRGTERQSHSDTVQKRIHTAVVLASIMTSFLSYEGDQLEAHHIPVKDYYADFAHSELGRTTEQEQTIEAALQKALGKRVTVRCAKIDTSPDSKAKPQDIYAFKYTEVLESDTLRLSPRVCEDLNRLKGISQFPDDKTFKRTADELKAVTSLGLWVANKAADSDTHACHTIQRTFDVAEDLGANENTAYDLAQSIALPYKKDEGRIDGCYEDGPLDIDRDKSAFIPLDPPA